MNARDELAYRIHDSAVAVNGQWAIRSGAATDAVIEFLTNDAAVERVARALYAEHYELFDDDERPAWDEYPFRYVFREAALSAITALLGEGE